MHSKSKLYPAVTVLPAPAICPSPPPRRLTQAPGLDPALTSGPSVSFSPLGYVVPRTTQAKLIHSQALLGDPTLNPLISEFLQHVPPLLFGEPPCIVLPPTHPVWAGWGNGVRNRISSAASAARLPGSKQAQTLKSWENWQKFPPRCYLLFLHLIKRGLKFQLLRKVV